jgi:teichuronic acid biosynthesis glycosyltransferase TuaG
MPNNEISNDSKLVSIIMPAYNSEKYIGESIDSVLLQTYKNWELIIVDDGSVDNTRKIVTQYAQNDRRINYYFQSNQKQGKARNTGINKSKGELIAFLDSDDLWAPEKLEIQVEYLKNSQSDLLFSNGYIYTHNSNNIIGSFENLTGSYQGQDAIELFLEHNRIPILSVLTYRIVLEKVGGFEENKQIQNVEDYHLWLKLLIAGFSFYGIPDKLVFYRQHDSQSTSKDAMSSEEVFYMLSNYVKVPKHLHPQLEKAKLRSVRDWYFRNASDRKIAIAILIKLLSSYEFWIISFVTIISLLLLGLSFSKRVLKKLINIKLKQFEILFKKLQQKR